MKHKTALLAFVFALCSLPASAQMPDGTEVKKHTGATAFGIFATTYGAGMVLQHYKYGEKNHFFYSVALSSTRDLRERKIISAYVDQKGKDFVWDKKNYLFSIAPTFGISKTLIPVSSTNRLALSARLAGGPMLGILKPYYVVIAVPITNTTAEPVPFAYDASRFVYDDIVGEGDFFLGIDSLSFKMGARLEGAVMLDFSGSKNYIRGIELGVFSDFYFGRPDILDAAQNRFNFTGGSIALLFGNKF
jgi:hypothetical protein